MRRTTTQLCTPPYAYCDLRCEACPLARVCEVSAATDGAGPLPPDPLAYSERRTQRELEVEDRIDRLVGEAYLARGARPDVEGYQRALEAVLFDPLCEQARDVSLGAGAWLSHWRSAWRCQILAPVREVGLVRALDAVSLCPPLASDKILRALWLEGVGGPPAEVEQPLGQARTATLALAELAEAWRTIERALPLAEVAPELERTHALQAALCGRFPQAAEFRRPGLDA